MKLVNLLPIASLASLGLVSAADVPFTSTTPAFKANFKVTGGEIQFCPTSECDTKSFSVKISKLTEYTPAAGDVAAADTTNVITSLNFDTAAKWTDLADVTESSKTIGSKSVFVTKLKKASGDGDDAAIGTLTITATAYTAAKSVTYGGATLSVPAGSVKFSADLATWSPATGNKFKLELTVTSTEKTDSVVTKPTLAAAVGTDTISKTVTIGGNMFLDVPTKAEVTASGTTTNIAATPSITDYKIVLDIENFKDKTLHYDPVMYYKAADTPATTTPAPTNSTTPAPSGASSVWGYAASVFVGAAGLAALMF